MSEPDEIKADILATRAELAETADALAAKLDVKAQAKAKVHAAGDKVNQRYARLRQSTPEPVQQALDKAVQHKKPVVLAAVGMAVALLVVKRLRK